MNLENPIATIMTTDVTSVHPSQKLIDVKHIFEKHHFHHHIPVTENDNLVGMISLIDYIHAIKDASLDDGDRIYHDLSVADIMSEHPQACSMQTTVREIALELAKGDLHAIAITDQNKLKGIVSTADIIKYLLT